MSITDAIVRALPIVAAACVIFVVLAIVFVQYGPITFWLLLVVLAIMLYNSIYVLRSDEMLAFFLFGTWRKTIVTGSYDAANNVVSRNENVNRGCFGQDVAFGLWPFFKAFRLPTATFEIPISASSMYTKVGKPGFESLPRIRLRGDGTLQIGLHPNVGRLGTVLQIFHQGETDLAKVVTLKDAPPGPDGFLPKGPKVADLVNGAVKKPMLQAMRTAASQFTWGTAGEGGDDTDIVNRRDEFEWAIQRSLIQPGSIFLRAGFLQEATEQERGNSRYHPKKGSSIIDFDVVIELVRPEPTPEDASELEKAIDLAFIGLQEGAREQAVERMKRVGQAEGLKAMAEELGIDDDKIQLVLLEAIREGKINLTMFGGSGAESLVGFVQKFIQKGESGVTDTP